MLRILALSLVLFIAGLARAQADEGPAKDTPELAVLNRYVGSWDVAITTKESPFAKGEAEAKWILGGRYVQQSGKLMSSDGQTVVETMSIMTYDKASRSYRTWTHLSDGVSLESTAKWDEATRTMTSTSRYQGATTTTTAKFAEDGTERWSIETVDASGAVIANFSGTNTRRKK